jgi:putative transposase
MRCVRRTGARSRSQDYCIIRKYCSAAYRSLQVSHVIETSMSRDANGWDNAPMESFFGTIKTESLQHHYRFATREQEKPVVFEYIEVFYNRIRCHATIGN